MVQQAEPFLSSAVSTMVVPDLGPVVTMVVPPLPAEDAAAADG